MSIPRCIHEKQKNISYCKYALLYYTHMCVIIALVFTHTFVCGGCLWCRVGLYVGKSKALLG